MSARRRVPAEAGRAAYRQWLDGDEGEIATAVRFTLEELASVVPGGAVEVRVPPYGAVQCVGGSRHTRGTPPNVVEADPAAWLALASGRLTWGQAVASGAVSASGAHADLAEYLPLEI